MNNDASPQNAYHHAHNFLAEAHPNHPTPMMPPYAPAFFHQHPHDEAFSSKFLTSSTYELREPEYQTHSLLRAQPASNNINTDHPTTLIQNISNILK